VDRPKGHAPDLIWTVHRRSGGGGDPCATETRGDGRRWRAPAPAVELAGDGQKGAPVHQNSRDINQKKEEDTRNSLRAWTGGRHAGEGDRGGGGAPAWPPRCGGAAAVWRRGGVPGSAGKKGSSGGLLYGGGASGEARRGGVSVGAIDGGGEARW
jgi:hypothetical protein